MARTTTDSRQVILRQFLQQLADKTHHDGTSDAKPASSTELDNLLTSIDTELQPPLRLDASDPIDLTVSVGPAIVANSESSRSRSIPHIGSLLPNDFSSGTVTFPSSSGGTITVTPGNNGTLTVPSNEFIKVLIYMDANGDLNVLPGTTDATEANATVLPAPSGTLPVGYVTLFNNAGTIDNVPQSDIVQFGVGGGAAASTGTGSSGGELADLPFEVKLRDELTSNPNSDPTPVDIGAGKTDSNSYDLVNKLYELSYDATLTVTGSGTANYILSSAPSFTIKAGDVLIVGEEVRRITAVNTQTDVDIESAFSTDPSSSACTVSQAVHTSDLNAFDASGDGRSPGSQYTGDIDEVLVSYEDSDAADDDIADTPGTAQVAFDVSTDLSSYSTKRTRPDSLEDKCPTVTAPTSNANLYLRFFANKTSGSGSVNLISYKVFFHKEITEQAGNVLHTAFARVSDGVFQNCTHAVVSGKSRFTFDFSYGRGLDPTKAASGALNVYANGQRLARWVDGTVVDAGQAFFKEISDQVIELDTDYSAEDIQFLFEVPVPVIDSRTTNTERVAELESVEAEREDYVILDKIDVPHTEITNRAQIVDLSNDLLPRFGIDRIMTQDIVRVKDEFGPNGEQVYGIVNDKFEQIRLVGNWFINNSAEGPQILTDDAEDFIEITFYGTGLNYIGKSDGTRDYRATVDGGAEGSDFHVDGSNVITGRNYTTNQIQPIISGLTLGLHTVKIRHVSGGVRMYGFEILNENSNIQLPPGSQIASNKKLIKSDGLTTTAYNSSFESGTLSTKGGHVSVYQKADGTVAKAVNPTDASQLNLSSADHSNEEVIRSYNWREFGAGRSDDFSTLSSTQDAAFTLDDGVTTLLGDDVREFNTIAVAADNPGSSESLTFTFVGTGLDILVDDDSSSTRSYDVIVDGVNVGSLSTPNVERKVLKVVSGLPYGTHIVKLVRTGTFAGFGIVDFIIYGPKKPSIPTGAKEIADYFILGDYSANSDATTGLTISEGILRKYSQREMVYVGSGWAEGSFLVANLPSAPNIFTNTNTDYVEYTFFGTGLDIRGFASSSTVSLTVDIDGSPYTGSATALGAGSSWTPGSSTWVVGTPVNSALQIGGLSLGVHTVRVTVSANGANIFNFRGLDIITPIHSPKQNGPYVLQGALEVGSQGIGDLRNFKKEDIVDVGKNSKSKGVSSGPSTTSTSFVPLEDMTSIVDMEKDGNLDIKFSAQVACSASGAGIGLQLLVDGIVVDESRRDFVAASNGQDSELSLIANVPVSKGTHLVQVFWRISSGTGSSPTTRRDLSVKVSEQ